VQRCFSKTRVASFFETARIHALTSTNRYARITARDVAATFQINRLKPLIFHVSSRRRSLRGMNVTGTRNTGAVPAFSPQEAGVPLATV
jgi:hypothetical protein